MIFTLTRPKDIDQAFFEKCIVARELRTPCRFVVDGGRRPCCQSNSAVEIRNTLIVVHLVS